MFSIVFCFSYQLQSYYSHYQSSQPKVYRKLARSITTLLEVSLPEASLPKALLTLSKPSVVSRLLVAATLSRPFLTTDGSKVAEFANVNKNVSNSTVGDCDNCSVRVGRVTAPSSPPTSTTSEPCSRDRSSQDAGGAQADER